MASYAATHVGGAHTDVDARTVLRRPVEEIDTRPLRCLLPMRAINPMNFQRVERVDAADARDSGSYAGDEKVAHRRDGIDSPRRWLGHHYILGWGPIPWGFRAPPPRPGFSVRNRAQTRSSLFDLLEDL